MCLCMKLFQSHIIQPLMAQLSGAVWSSQSRPRTQHGSKPQAMTPLAVDLDSRRAGLAFGGESLSLYIYSLYPVSLLPLLGVSTPSPLCLYSLSSESEQALPWVGTPSGSVSLLPLLCVSTPSPLVSLLPLLWVSNDQFTVSLLPLHCVSSHSPLCHYTFTSHMCLYCLFTVSLLPLLCVSTHTPLCLYSLWSVSLLPVQGVSSPSGLCH